MGAAETVLALSDLVMREAALFAACGFLLLGLSDLAVDLLWIGLLVAGRLRPAALPVAQRPGRLAVFVPAWDEAAVIGDMLAHAQATFGAADHLLYVGCYPNDPATIAAVRAAAGPYLRLVVGPAPGPTSKADCLNRLWERMVEDEAVEGIQVKAVVLHDAEDVVHSAELPLFDALIERVDLVQLPVLPLVDPGSRSIGGHYIDEFCEAHGKELVVRAAIGASLPSAGVGCAVSRAALAALADARGAPFDPDSLTEDYELGLRLKAIGRPAAFVRLAAGPGRPPVATREYFPATLAAAVAQKARWMTGIALAGWDRLGWSGGLAERWMRLRDRLSPLAALVLAAAYLALLLWAALAAAQLATGWTMPPFTPLLSLLIAANSGLLLWRLVMRFGFVARSYGWREGLRALPRAVIGNIVAMMAARRALGRYCAGRAGWDKTAHNFPRQLPAE
jgi:adsorption protein B